MKRLPATQLIFKLFVFFTAVNLSKLLAEPLPSQGANGVTIPSFGPDGKVTWTLEAEEVSPVKESTYHVKKPNLKMITKGNSFSKASSDEAIFDLDKGKARGSTLLKVSGNGYLAGGNKWSWQEKVDHGFHQLSFESNAYVQFKSDLEPPFSSKQTDAGVRKKEPERAKDTKALADLIEVVSLDKGGYLFILDGNVSVEGESMKIHCLKMYVVVESENNQSDLDFGRIVEVNATGRVTMLQAGRICQADKLNLNTIDGRGLLVGNARVEDAEWGVVTGDKVELDRISGRARVLGNGNQRPRLELPDFGKIKLPGLTKPQKNSPQK